jgi:hypothetical protein
MVEGVQNFLEKVYILLFGAIVVLKQTVELDVLLPIYLGALIADIDAHRTQK